MAIRGVLVSYETVRSWCDKFGKQYADGLRRRRAQTGDKWRLDEVFLKINGVTHYLWRAACGIRSCRCRYRRSPECAPLPGTRNSGRSYALAQKQGAPQSR